MNDSTTYDDEIDLYELWLTLKRHKRIVVSITGIFTLVGILLCFLLPPTYQTKTSLMPLGGKKMGLSSLLPASLPIPIPSSQSGITVEAVLKSRTLKERIINDLNLLPKLFPKKWDSKDRKWKLKGSDDEPPTILDGVKKLEKLMSVDTDRKTNVITLTVEFPRNPEIAYEIAKVALSETNKILNEKSFTLARKYRIYVGKRLETAERTLKMVNNMYKAFSEGKLKEVPLLSENMELPPKLQEKINRLRNNYYVSTPDYQLNLMKLKADFDIATNMYETLLKQYEIAKAQEEKQKISFQVIDPPYVPDIHKPYKPKKKLIVAVALISGLFLGIFGAFFKEWIENVKPKRVQ